MKRITITYRMEKRNETAENCITIPASGRRTILA